MECIDTQVVPKGRRCMRITRQLQRAARCEKPFNWESGGVPLAPLERVIVISPTDGIVRVSRQSVEASLSAGCAFEDCLGQL